MSDQSPAYRTYRWFGSIWFLITLLSLILLTLLFGSWFGIDITNGALRTTWYSSVWFNTLVGLLMVNLTICTVVRKPWKNFWQWGFLITHTGILTLMIGTVVTWNSKIYGDMRVAEGQTRDWFEIENERELTVQDKISGESATFDIPYSRYSASNEPLPLVSSKLHASMRVVEYIPNTEIEPTYVAGPDGEPVVHVAFHSGEGRPTKKYLRLDEQLSFGDRLTIIYSRISDETFANLTEPSGEQGTLVLTIDGEEQEIDVAKSIDKPVAFRAGDVTIKKVTDLGVEFTLKRVGREAGTFIASVSGGVRGSGVDFKGRLRMAMRASMIIIAQTETGFRYLNTSQAGKRDFGPLAPNRKIPYPFMPLPFHIELLKSIDSAVETAVETPVGKQGYNPAVKVAYGSNSTWIKFTDEPRRIQVGQDTYEIYFGGKRFEKLPFALQLLKFEKPVNPGTTQAARFQSDVVIEDKITHDTMRRSILVNEPFTVQKWVIYQASFQDMGDGRFISVFQIAWDPGKKIIYLGGLMAVSGTIFMFFFQPFLKKLIQGGAKASDPPLGEPSMVQLLVLACAGTLGGAAIFWQNPGVNGVFVGLGVAAIDILLVFAISGQALHWQKTSRAGRALQLGKILSASWCINTAGLVIFMWMRIHG